MFLFLLTSFTYRILVFNPYLSDDFLAKYLAFRHGDLAET